jgi:hypothetical protein
MASNPAIALWLQSARLVAAVGELGSLGNKTHTRMRTIRVKPQMKLMGGPFVILLAMRLASAQDITLTITPAVQLSWPSTTNRAYQVLAATNVSGPYVAAGPLIEGTGNDIGTFFSATNAHRFFEVAETNASGMTWLEGNWVGTIWQSGSGLTTTNFTAHFNISNSNRQFTATYVWPGGSSCTASLDLLSYSDTQAQFYSDITSGGCIGSTVALIRTPNATNVACSMYVVNVGGAGGLLQRQ